MTIDLDEMQRIAGNSPPTVREKLQGMIDQIRELRAENDKLRSLNVKAVAFCARLQGTDDIPERVVDEAKEIVRQWKQAECPNC